MCAGFGLLPSIVNADKHSGGEGRISRWLAIDSSCRRVSPSAVNVGSFLKQKVPAGNDSAITKEAMLQSETTMERGAGTQVTSPAFFFHHHELFHDSTIFGKKWEPPWQNPSFRRPTPQISSPVIPTPSHPDQWDWDSRDFAAKPAKLYGENLSLMLGGGDFASVEEQVSVATVRPNKRVHTASPGSGGGYQICQVDDCQANFLGRKIITGGTSCVRCIAR